MLQVNIKMHHNCKTNWVLCDKQLTKWRLAQLFTVDRAKNSYTDNLFRMLVNSCSLFTSESSGIKNGKKNIQCAKSSKGEFIDFVVGLIYRQSNPTTICTAPHITKWLEAANSSLCKIRNILCMTLRKWKSLFTTNDRCNKTNKIKMCET